MTIWMVRVFSARHRLLEHYSRHASLEVQQTEEQRQASVSCALSMLECDAKLLTSPVVKGYYWFVYFHFPMLAHVHILRYLREQPESDQSRMAWKILSENYEAHVMKPKSADAIFAVCSRLVLQAWKAREDLSKRQGEPTEMPWIVSDIQDKARQIWTGFSPQGTAEQLNGVVGSSLDQSLTSMSSDYTCEGINLQGFASSEPGGYHDILTPTLSGSDAGQLWNPLDWISMGLQDQ
ncbi:uncharacterized protein BCR38DRAFT_410790 [Pseudomassariella vexata]|uniref:Uncharacterized protein n=1 Tax=Pseudomassariella vexata TaxID=1141098 RepID=A0A1Y2DSZ1_9PEZI|nr:uncharacterized protein BCR38DRAFT_410790 [Pseudomassariella vexata]ORY62367.1 hypothetical protein BCR38DRAFT_410790 [Pseudomassariella vexata]